MGGCIYVFKPGLFPNVNTAYTIFSIKLLYMGHFHVLISWMLSWEMYRHRVRMGCGLEYEWV